MPSKGTPLRNVRVPDDVWRAAQVRAEMFGYGSASGFILAALVKLAAHEQGTGRIVVTPPPRTVASPSGRSSLGI
jgi:hypothetical protein